MAKIIAARDAAEQLGLTYEGFLRKVRKKQIDAEKVGYAVVMTEEQLEKAKKKCS